LTPHPGEAAALLGCDAASIQADRLAALARLQRLAPCLWVLKGAGTWVGRQGDAARLCPIAAPNLAVAGSGDVLAGCLGALIAQGVPPHTAACAGVLLHAHAGLLLAKTFPRRGNSASDIADALPSAGLGG
jgi:NAD(P)H-hydrate epimerase